MPRLTLWGIYQYDNTLFSEIILPAGLDKDTLVNLIFSKTGDLYPYYQVPQILKQNINFWFMRRRYDFEQMYKAYTSEYNPIENYNRYEDLNRAYKNSGSDSTVRDYESKDKATGEEETIGNTKTDSNTTTDTNSIGVDIESVSAYNASDFSNRTKHDTTDHTTTTGTATGTTADSTTSNTNNESSTEGIDNSTTTYGAVRDEKENNHVHGNIGITTTQAMIESELNMRMNYDLYAMIVSLFEHEFIVEIY